MRKHLNQRSAVINQNKLTKQAFDFRLYQPSGTLSTFIQGIWSASVSPCRTEPVVKQLYADAGCDILFNLAGNAAICDEVLPKGVIMLPVNKAAKRITLPPGTNIAGLHFHPAMAYGVLGRHYDKPTILLAAEDQRFRLYQLYAALQTIQDSQGQIDALYRWADSSLDFTNIMPNSLAKALTYIAQGSIPGQLNQNINLSQRQIERLFKVWLGITPKYYQRIVRTKQAISFLREHKNVGLVNVAQQFGFSDQAHMTREFRSIAYTTPGKL